MAGLEKVKVLVIGDSGVGKSSLAHVICHGQPITNPSWTIGASLDVKVHVYKDGTPQQKKYFVELWDVGGCIAHKNTRSVFYNNANGLILVHDLTNKKSCFNLRNWIGEVLTCVQRGSGESALLSAVSSSSATSTSWWGAETPTGYDPETFAGSSQMPILIFGTKQDLTTETRYRKRSPIADEVGADEIFLNCHDRACLPSGSSAAVKLSRFFDKVIERRHHPSGSQTQSDLRGAFLPDRRRVHHNFGRYNIGE